MGQYGHKFDSLIESKNKEVLEENAIQAVNEGVLSTFVISVAAGISYFLLFNALLIGALVLSSKVTEKKAKKSMKDIAKNPKSKALILKAMKALQDFVFQNLPGDVKKYAKKTKDLDFEDAANGVNVNLVEFDMEKMIKDLTDCKDIKELYEKEFCHKKEFESKEEREKYIDHVMSNPDCGVGMEKYPNFTKVVDRCNNTIKYLNKQVEGDKKYKGTKVKFFFEDYGNGLQVESDSKELYTVYYINAKFKLPKLSITSFSDKDLEYIAKTCGVSVEDLKGEEE